jgi:hypothetical protein
MVSFLAPGFADYTGLLVLVSAVFAETGFCIYLLSKGVRKTDEYNLASA